MSNTVDLINKLRKLNIRLELVKGQLEIIAQKGLLTPELVDELKLNKTDLIKYLEVVKNEGFRSVSAIEEQEYYGVSNAQMRLWLMHQYYDDLTAYNEQVLYSLAGAVDTNIFKSAFLFLIQRHEILRTRIIVIDNQPRQKVLSVEACGITVDVVDIRNNVHRKDQIASQDATKIFSLEKGPLLKVRLLQVADDSFIFLLTIHHIIADVWSMRILLEEFLTLYDTFSKQALNSLPPLKVQYKDFSAWQNNQLSGDNLQMHQSFWIDKFSGEIPVLDFPLDYNRPSIKTFTGRDVSFSLGGSIYKKIKTLCKEQDVTLFVFLTASVKVLLHKYTNQDDITVGSPIAGRFHVDLEDQVGFYVNTLPLRTIFDAKDNFENFLEKVNETCVGAFEHQIYPFDKLIEDLGLSGSLARTPLFEVLITLANVENKKFHFSTLDNINIDDCTVENKVSKFDLAFNFSELDEEIKVTLTYNTDLFAQDTLLRIAEHFKKSVECFTEDLKIPLHAIQIISPAERLELLSAKNATSVSYPSDKTVHALFTEQALRFPDRIALKYEGLEMSYEELNSRSNQLAHYLIDIHGVVKGDIVGLMTDRSPQLIIGILGILKAGAAYLPIDPSYPKERLQYVISDSGIQLIIKQEYLADPVCTCRIQAIGDTFSYIKRDTPPTIVNAGDLIYILYTSGSTGQPKGVMIHHRSVVNFLYSMQKAPGLHADDKLLAVTSYSFDISVLELMLPLISGAQVLLVSQNTLRTPSLLINVLQAEEPTIMQGTPSFWSMLVGAGWQGSSGLKILCGGEKLSRELGRQLLYRSASLWNMYGPTEATIWSTIKEILTDSDLDSIGKPIHNTQIFILDKYLNPVPMGVNGDLYIGGSGLAKGYHNKPELTKEKFIHHPFSDHEDELLYQTGDIARWRADGDVVYVSRSDNQVKVRGYRIELGEIESSLLKHTGIQEATVLSKTTAEGEVYLAGFYIAKEPLDKIDIIDHLRPMLPEYMLPQYLIGLTSFPLTPNGKLDKLKLSEMVVSDNQAKEVILPENEIEERLLEIWQTLLKREVISTHDNFFHIGGHSLKIIQLASRIHKELNFKIDFKNVFDYPTIKQLATFLTDTSNNQYKSIDPIEEQEYYDLSQTQRMMWAMHNLDKRSNAYTIHNAYNLQGNLDVKAFSESFKSLIKRHESLRSVFIQIEGDVKVKIIDSEVFAFEIQYVDLKDVDDRENEAKHIINNQTTTGFDLEMGPLIKVSLIKIGDAQFIFSFNIHHIISDAWSINVLLKDVLELYDFYTIDSREPLSPLNIQSKDYVAWYNKQFQAGAFKKHEEFWLNLFKDEISPINLPVDFSKDKVKTTTAAKSIGFTLSKEISHKLKMLSNEVESTLHTVVFSALSALLSYIGNQDDILIGSPVSGRNHLELENQIGLYINILPIRTKINRNVSFATLFCDVKENSFEAYKYQQYSIDLLLDKLKSKRTSTNSSFYNVGFTWQLFDQIIKENGNKTPENIAIYPLGSDIEDVKTDFWIHASEAENEVSFSFVYNMSLFLETTIIGIVDLFKELIEIILDHSSQSIDYCFQTLTDRQKKRNVMNQQQSRKKNLDRFLNIKKNEINISDVSIVEKTSLGINKTYPLIIKPKIKGVILSEWVKENKLLINKELLKCGAILFRGFDVNSAESFQEFSASLSNNHLKYFDQSSPRTQIGEKLYTSTDHPADQTINMHNELSYSHDWPMQIMFFCNVPAEEGGETPIADNRRVFNIISEVTRDKFSKTGIKYVRNLIDGIGLSWQNVYQTSDKSVVEQHCLANDIHYEWKNDKHLKISWVRPAIQEHPLTKEPIWFNHGFFFNSFNLDQSIKEVIGDSSRFPFETTFGDGTPIDAKIALELKEAYYASKEEFKWEKGDILLLDNMLMSHGRNPYKGNRSILVSMNEPYSLKR